MFNFIITDKESLSQKMSLEDKIGEYNFDKDPDRIHFSKKAYNMIISVLSPDEYIIKKVFEHGLLSASGIGGYNVCYLSNYGKVYYSAYNKKYNRFDGPIKEVKCSESKLEDYQITQIDNYEFKSNHYSKVKRELADYLKLVDNIVSLAGKN